MTDESDLSRRLIEAEVERRLEELRGNDPLDSRRIAKAIADEVLLQMRRYRIQVVRIHTASEIEC